LTLQREVDEVEVTKEVAIPANAQVLAMDKDSDNKESIHESVSTGAITKLSLPLYKALI